MQSKQINSHQAKWYSEGEKQLIFQYMEHYGALISEMKSKENLRILDVGGGAGYFISQLSEVLSPNNSYYVIDTHRYDTWDDANPKIAYCQCDAAMLSFVFEKESFDYVFCNMLFHHLVTSSYKESALIRENCLKEILHVLKADGKLCIVDNFCDGLFHDQLSSRLIFTMTTCKNPILARLFSKLGSNSAGVGVCMLSEKMWMAMLTNAGLNCLALIKEADDGLGLIKKAFLMNRSYRQFNTMICEKTKVR